MREKQIRNPNIEIPNKQQQIKSWSKPQNGACLGFFFILNLFRTSDFEFATYSAVASTYRSATPFQ